MVENLLQNAVKYSPGGGEVRLAVRRERETARVSVSDRGIGIARRGHGRSCSGRSRGCTTARASGIEGFGLGLSICERFVRAHGGRFVGREPAGRGLDLQLHAAALRRRGPGARAGRSWSGRPTPGTRRDVRRAAEARRLRGARGPGRRRGGGGRGAAAAGRARARADPAAAAGRRGGRAAPGAGRDARACRSCCWAPADGTAFKAGLFRECLPHPLDRRMLQTALERLGAPVH